MMVSKRNLLFQGAIFQVPMLNFWGGYLHAHLSSISVCGRIRQVTPRQLAFLGLGKKVRCPNLFGKKFRNSSIFLPPLRVVFQTEMCNPNKINWSRFEIPKLFTRSSALRSSISLVLVSSQSWNSPGRKSTNACGNICMCIIFSAQCRLFMIES